MSTPYSEERKQGPGAFAESMQWIAAILLLLGLITTQVLIGGARLVFGLPGYILIGAAGIFLIFSPIVGRLQRSAWICIAATLVFGGYIILRTQTSPIEYLGRTDLYMTAGALLVYGITTLQLATTRWRILVVSAMLVCVVGHVLSGAVQFKQGDNFMLLPGIFRPDYQARASGFYICPNHLAGLLEMVGMMALGLCCWGRCRVWVRIVLGYGVALCVAGIAITGSRGGYLSTTFGLLVFASISLWVIRRVRPDRFVILSVAFFGGIVLLLGGTLLVMFESDMLKDRVGLIYDPTNMRLHLWQTALQQFHLSPLTGTGSGSYLYLGRQMRSPLVQNDPIHVHCDYLELLTEYGIAGAASAAVFLATHLMSGFRGVGEIVRTKLEPAWETSSNELALSVGAISGIMALLFHSAVDFNFHIPANTLVGAFLFGILARPTRGGVAPVAARNGGWVRWLLPLASLALLLLSAWRMPGEYYAESARVAFREKDYVASQKFAEEGLGFERGNPDLFFYLGEAVQGRSEKESSLAIRQGLVETSAEAFQEGLLLFPQDTRLLLKLGKALDDLRRFNEAEVILQRAVANDPNFGNVYAYYGLHWLAQNKLKEARENFEKALRFSPNELASLGMQSIDSIEKNPMFKVLEEFMRQGSTQPPGNTAAPLR